MRRRETLTFPIRGISNFSYTYKNSSRTGITAPRCSSCVRYANISDSRHGLGLGLRDSRSVSRPGVYVLIFCLPSFLARHHSPHLPKRTRERTTTTTGGPRSALSLNPFLPAGGCQPDQTARPTETPYAESVYTFIHIRSAHIHRFTWFASLGHIRLEWIRVCRVVLLCDVPVF